MKLEWDDNLELGIEKLDEQRKMLFEKINKSFQDLKFDNDIRLADSEKIKRKLDDLFYFLTDYFITHFKLEEEFHREYNFEGYEVHKKLHQEIIETVNELKYEFLNLDEISEIDKSVFAAIESEVLILWKQHIKQEDMELKEAIEE